MNILWAIPPLWPLAAAQTAVGFWGDDDDDLPWWVGFVAMILAFAVLALVLTNSAIAKLVFTAKYSPMRVLLELQRGLFVTLGKLIGPVFGLAEKVFNSVLALIPGV